MSWFSKAVLWLTGSEQDARKALERQGVTASIEIPGQVQGEQTDQGDGRVLGGVVWPVDRGSHGMVGFLTSPVFLAHYDAKQKRVYMLDKETGQRHDGAKPLILDENVFVATGKKRSGRGTVIRTALLGEEGIYRNVFRHDVADLIAHHVNPDPPENSSLVSDPDGDSDRQGGLHYPLRVREWAWSFCTKTIAKTGKLFAPLFNMGRNGDGTPAFGAAHWDRDEGTLSDEGGGPLATADDGNHILAFTNEVDANRINQGGLHIMSLYGPIDGRYMPEELIPLPYERGSKGPFVVIVEKRPDLTAKHKNHCGKEVPGLIKWQSYAMFREYPPAVPPDDPPTDDPPEGPPRDPGEPGSPITPTGGGKKKGGPGSPITGEDAERKRRGKEQGKPPAMLVPPENGIPPTAATPNEIESPSRYGHPAPAIPDGEPTRGPGDAPGDALPEHPQDLFWDNRYGWREKAWHEFSNVCTHEYSLPVYESATRGTGPNPWPVKNAHRAGLLQLDAQGNIIGRDANVGDGTVIDGPAWSKPWHALSSLHSATWRESDHARIVLAGKNSAGVTIDGRLGLGARGLTSAFIASGHEFSLAFDGDGTTSTPDTHFNAKTSAAANDALGLAKLVINPRLKTTAGRERKSTDTSGNLTLDATHHFVNITGAHTVTLPATVVAGREYEIHNSSGGARTIARNGNNINGAASDFTLPDNSRALVSTEADAGGWLIAQLGEAAPSGSGDMLAANNLSDLASDDTAISNLVGGGTSRTPTELHEVGITDINALGTAHGRCSIAALRQQVVTADNTLIHAFGSDSTDGPWRRILSRNFSTGGAGALETAMTITKPAADATITLRISITGKRSDSAREYRGNFIVGFEDTSGTLAADGTDWSAEGGSASGSIAFSFDASGNDMRIRVNDSGDLFRLGIMVEVEWRTSSA